MRRYEGRRKGKMKQRNEGGEASEEMGALSKE